MSTQPHPVSRFPSLRKLWKPTVATGAESTTLIIWFEEIIVFAADFIGVILLTILGGLICLFDNFIFKSRTPWREDLQGKTNKGEKNETSTHVPSHGYSPVRCLRLSLDEKCLCSCDAAAHEITKS